MTTYTLTGGNFEDEDNWMTLDELLDQLERERRQKLGAEWWEGEDD